MELLFPATPEPLRDAHATKIEREMPIAQNMGETGRRNLQKECDFWLFGRIFCRAVKMFPVVKPKVDESRKQGCFHPKRVEKGGTKSKLPRKMQERDAKDVGLLQMEGAGFHSFSLNRNR